MPKINVLQFRRSHRLGCSVLKHDGIKFDILNF